MLNTKSKQTIIIQSNDFKPPPPFVLSVISHHENFTTKINHLLLTSTPKIQLQTYEPDQRNVSNSFTMKTKPPFQQ